MKVHSSEQTIKWFLSTLSMVLGFTIIIFAIGQLIVRLLFAALGIWFIAYGFQLKTGNSMKKVIYTAFFGRRWF
ncbi:hypothetical protein EKK58_05105 [Candidatus Dependentiae bacterium]|nr:MAG: hypothetical protein EKK58_05105 [Candidatus Dependentiae bacterium]